MTARRAVACRLSEEHVAALERVRVEQSLPLLSDAVRVVIERGLAGAPASPRSDLLSALVSSPDVVALASRRGIEVDELIARSLSREVRDSVRPRPGPGARAKARAGART